jgi:hypothetical protein
MAGMADGRYGPAWDLEIRLAQHLREARRSRCPTGKVVLIEASPWLFGFCRWAVVARRYEGAGRLQWTLKSGRWRWRGRTAWYRETVLEPCLYFPS